MGNQSQAGNDQALAPGGEPDQPPDDLPAAPTDHRADHDERKTKKKDKIDYGHIEEPALPRPDGAPPPHQIY